METSGVQREELHERKIGCLLIAVMLMLVLLIALAILLRSAWWEEAGAPLPRGTERVVPLSSSGTHV